MSRTTVKSVARVVVITLVTISALGILVSLVLVDGAGQSRPPYRGPIPKGAVVGADGRLMPDPANPIWVPPDGFGDGANGNSGIAPSQLAAELRTAAADLPADSSHIWSTVPERVLYGTLAGVLELISRIWGH